MIPWRRNPIFLSWESPWTEEPGGLQSKGSRRVGHDWAQQHPQNSTEKPCFSIKKKLITNECITLCWLKLRLKGYSHWNIFSWTIHYYSIWQFFFTGKKVIKDKHNTYSLMAIFSECLEDTEDMLWDIWNRTVWSLHESSALSEHSPGLTANTSSTMMCSHVCVPAFRAQAPMLH